MNIDFSTVAKYAGVLLVIIGVGLLFGLVLFDLRIDERLALLVQAGMYFMYGIIIFGIGAIHRLVKDYILEMKYIKKHFMDTVDGGFTHE